MSHSDAASSNQPENLVDSTQQSMQYTGTEFHTITVSPSSKEEKLGAYASLAPLSNKRSIEVGYIAPRRAVICLLPYIKSFSISKNHDMIRVLDAGCGTGLCVDHFTEFWRDEKRRVQIIGVDFSQVMLNIAEKRDTYDHLLLADITQPFDIPSGDVHFLVAAGVFLEGHCGPEGLTYLLAHLKDGGYACITVRNMSFEAAKKDYIDCFEKCHCEVVENLVQNYATMLEANYIVLRKKICKVS